ncbi:MAG: FAD-dependent oxidoreductase [Rhodopirellula sp.]|nr:FAD-dependent oxidoreductase [Rhodopirellula sp.]
MTQPRNRFARRNLIAAAAGAAGWLLGRRFVWGSTQAETPADPQAIPWSRSVPVRYQADVAVIGGGIAGVAAACAAARSGAQVVLVERFAVTGGDLTAGGVANFCGETTGQGEVFDEIVADLERFGAIAPYQHPYPKQSTRVFDHHILATVLQEILLRRGVKLLLHTPLADVVRSDDGRLTAGILCGKSGPEAMEARQFIDASGEADVVRRAGFPVMKGRPQDGLQLPMSMMFFVRHVDEQHAQAQLPEGWFEPVRAKEDLPMTSVWPNGPGSSALKVKIPGFDSTDTESFTAAEIRARRRVWEVLDYYQQVEKKPWRYDGCSPQIGIREGARAVGRYVLSVDDLRAGRTFDDAVARGVFYLDGHKPDDDKRTYILSKDQLHVPPYQIPLRSLIVRDAKNLLVAGRCFSADQLALSSARVSTTCAMMGQAAGIAAAMSVEEGCDPFDLDPRDVRRVVEERGARLEN